MKGFSQSWSLSRFCFGNLERNTVDGRNPAPVDRYFIPLFTGFCTSQVVSRISLTVSFEEYWDIDEGGIY